MSIIRAISRLLLFVVLVIVFLLVGAVIILISPDSDVKLKRFSNSVNFFCKLIVKTFGIRLSVKNKPDDNSIFLMVSNHMGFIDILANGSTFPMLFVTSREMRETPVLGLITEMGGCIYVERRSRSKILDELYMIAEVMKKGFRVVLYPEATSTNGEQVLPFKKTLIMAAAYAGVPIQPVVVNFLKINEEEFTLKWRDHVCWYGDIPFIVAIWRAFSLKNIDVEIEFLPSFQPQPEDDRGVIADKAHALITERFIPVKQ